MLYDKHPLKGLYALYAILSTILRLPVLIATSYLDPPREGWTFLQTLMNHLIREYLRHVTALRIKFPQNLDPGNFGERFITVPASKKDVYVGILASDPSIKPLPIGAAWYPELPKADTDELTVLHFHGGGYVIGDVRAEATFAAGLLTKYIGRALFPDYRLASNEGGYWPAALQDAVSSYEYLLSSGVAASNIVVSGDSAGAHLTIALIRYIAEEKTLPAPRAALLWSPPTSMAEVMKGKDMNGGENSTTDYLADSFLVWAASALTTGCKVGPENPYLSPLGFPFKTETPILVHVGGSERLCYQGVKFAEEMKGVEGNQIETYVEPLANHDILLLGDKLGFQREAHKGAMFAGEFVK